MLPESTIHAEKSYTIASPDIVWQCFEDELILIHLGTGVYYSVTPGGAAIWRLMEAGYTPAGIVSHVENGPAGEQDSEFLAETAGGRADRARTGRRARGSPAGRASARFGARRAFPCGL